MLSNKKGFTLIELLIVVVIIGILAAIGIPKFANTKEKSYVASMKADLRNLVTAEEAYFADWNTYGTRAQLDLAYTTSAGVTVATDNVTGGGWTATASHVAIPAGGTTCLIKVGVAAPLSTDREGEPVCQ